MRYARFLLLGLLALVASWVVTEGIAFDAPVHDLAITPADVTVLGADSEFYRGDRLPNSMAAGDFNGDGIDDVLVSAQEADGTGNAKEGAGEAYVIFGSPSLGGTIDLDAASPDLTVLGADAGDLLGRSAGAGDFNGDGIDDIVLGSHAAGVTNAKTWAGEAYVIFGSATLGGTIDLATTSADLTVVGADAGDTLGGFKYDTGKSVTGGDFNGDGIDDLLLGAPSAQGPNNTRTAAGEAYVIFGSPTLGGTIDLAVDSPDFTILEREGRAYLGQSVAAGDFNDDGIDDVLISAHEASVGGEPKVGKAYVIFGSPTLGGTIDLASVSPGLTVLGRQSSGILGNALAAGDFNGDGTSDLLVGAWATGEAYVIFGSPTLGGTIDLATTSADLTVVAADGAADVLGHDAAAGDFNGDGIGDLLLGTPGASAEGNLKWHAGEAYVVFGSLTLGGTIDLATTSADLTVFGADEVDSLGWTVAAGDFNGDGGDDLLLGAAGADGPGTGTCDFHGPGGEGDRCEAGEAYVIYGEPAVSDEDQDGVPDGDDACPTNFGFADRQGCPVGDVNTVELHVVNQAKSPLECGGKGSCKSSIAGAEVRVFDRNDGDFQLQYGTKNPSGTIYDQVWENDVGRVGACTTDGWGWCTAGEETKGDYLVIVKWVDTSEDGTCSDDHPCVYTGKPKSPEDFVDGLASKDFQVIKVLKKNGDIQISGGSKTVVTGSYLEVVHPDFAIWEDVAAGYVYPFIFASDSDWTVDVCAYVPEGYAIVGVYDENGDLLTDSSCTQTFVSGETKVAAFDVIEVGSPEPILGALLTVEHEGTVTEVDIEVPGERTYVEEPVAQPAELPDTGAGEGGGGTPMWPTVAALSGVAAMLLGGIVIWRRRRTWKKSGDGAGL